ncbi:hypothetical protein BH24BAC1_BH24BAC1_40010 [soil metagenome]|jgi:hypothetical protein
MDELKEGEICQNLDLPDEEIYRIVGSKEWSIGEW